MKKFILSIIVLLNIFIFPSESQLNYPKLAFKYDWRGKMMDAAINLYYQNDTIAKLKNKLDNQLPNLIAAWQSQAPVLFQEIFSNFKRGFKQNSRTAIINLSHFWSYGSHKFLILGLRSFLEEPWDRPISPEDNFVWIVFHELIHVWVDENVKSNSPLLEKYANEHNEVKEHIHLMAIQKMVYQNLNRLDLLNYTDESYNHFAPQQYKRAWEIVNIEGYETVINDIMPNLT